MSNSVEEDGEKSEKQQPTFPNQTTADQTEPIAKDANELGSSAKDENALESSAKDTDSPNNKRPSETPPNTPTKEDVEQPHVQSTTESETDQAVNIDQLPVTQIEIPVEADKIEKSTASVPDDNELPVTSTPKTPTSAGNASSGVSPTSTTTTATEAVNAAVAAATAKEMSKKKKKKSAAGETLPANAGRVGSGIEIIRIKEKHGQFRKAMPIMPLPLAVILCFVNVVLPGIGTLFSAFTVFCCGKTEFESKGKAFSVNVTAAILQIITIPIIVGWIWSIIWGVTFITTSLSKNEDKDEDQSAAQQV